MPCVIIEQDSEKKLMASFVTVGTRRTLCPVCLPHVGYKMLMGMGTGVTLTVA